MRYSVIIITTLAGIAAATGFTRNGNDGVVAKTTTYFKTRASEFSSSTEHLSSAINRMDARDTVTIHDIKEKLAACRIQYKFISCLLEYFFPPQAQSYNSPAKYEAEEPYIEYEAPRGLQQIEALLYSPNPGEKKSAMQDEVKVILESAKDLGALLYDWRPSPVAILESLRMEIIRIMTLYIEGYDAPFLKSGLAESISSLSSISEIISYYPGTETTVDKANRAINYLTTHPGFDDFNRLRFICAYIMPLETDIDNLILHVDPSYPHATLFDNDIKPFDQPGSKEMIRLGKKLFFDKRLSGSHDRSCASCHKPDHYYTDGMAKNFSLNGDSLLSRNTPTILYAAYQNTQFWDGRVKSLPEQVRSVLTSKKEMNSNEALITTLVHDDPYYKAAFTKAFHTGLHQENSMNQLCKSITAFIQTLSPKQSAFDRYVHGEKTSMTAMEIKGFNLFAGKAGCATCHFIPLFNGLTPPDYKRSEFEILGVPATENLSRPVQDPDSGHYVVSSVWFNRSAFKTPTLRDITKTAPYMHNGSFKSLSTVLDFYNRGGGVSIGLDVPEQTLSSKPLGLTEDEKEAIISFLGSLTDSKDSINP